eukprot:Nitzschia sp. Nitz4//scaffold16_size188269//51006//52546//NITZ4_001784-RA/size188269-processed-gene-0.50-mRNA-1//-1//CDS//3329538496//6495//frame0
MAHLPFCRWYNYLLGVVLVCALLPKVFSWGIWGVPVTLLSKQRACARWIPSHHPKSASPQSFRNPLSRQTKLFAELIQDPWTGEWFEHSDEPEPPDLDNPNIPVIDIDDVPNKPIVAGPEEWELPKSPHPPVIPEVPMDDLIYEFENTLTVNKPESEKDKEISQQILQEFETGERTYPDWALDEYDHTYDPDYALNPGPQMDWLEDDSDPNELDPVRTYYQEDIDGPKYQGNENVTFDSRTEIGSRPSYRIDPHTAPEGTPSPLERQFRPGDPELQEQLEYTKLQQSLRIIETYTDKFLPNMSLPAHTATWYGYPEPMGFPKKSYLNNRFIDPSERVDYDAMKPSDARRFAIQEARSKNAQWLPPSVSKEYHQRKRAIFEHYGILAGTVLPGPIDEEVAEKIQPALRVFGNIIELLSIEDSNFFRFKYHGPIKDRHGIESWVRYEIEQVGIENPRRTHVLV